jgi:hypothetical protein
MLMHITGEKNVMSTVRPKTGCIHTTRSLTAVSTRTSLLCQSTRYRVLFRQSIPYCQLSQESSQFQHKSLVLDTNIKLDNAACAEQDATIGPSACDNMMQVDVKNLEVSNHSLRCCALTNSNSLH